MATKTFKIGLSNTDKQNMAQDVYERLLALTFPEYDTTTSYEVGDFVVYNDQLYKCIGATSGAWDSTKWQLATLNDLLTDIEDAVAFVNDKANVDGNYPTMTVGAADNLTPYSEDAGDDQDVPFSFQGTGCGNGETQVDTGALALLKEKRGNTVVVNQWLQTNAISSGSNNDISCTNNGDGTYTLSGTASAEANFIGSQISIPVGHKVILIGGKTSPEIYVGLTHHTNTTGSKIFEITQSGSIYITINPNVNVGTTTIRPYLIDLTQMFNGDIPQDLLDHPENFFRYYQGSLAYNQGELVNANSRYLKAIGRNQWDEEWELGVISGQTGANQSSSTQIRSKNYIRVNPNSEYYFKCQNAGNTYFYDKDKNFISYTYMRENNTYVIPSNVCYMRFTMSSAYGTAYNHDITISIYYEGESGYDQYYPYEVLTNNDTGTEVLRSAGSIADSKAPDGTVHRLVGTVDLSTLSWSYANDTFYAELATVSFEGIYNLTCSKYVATKQTHWSLMGDKEITEDSGYIFIKDSAYNDAATFTSAMNGVYLFYELAAPTTEQGTIFSENLVIDDFGSMDFSGTSGVPQGNLIFYPVDYKAFIDSLYNELDGSANKVLSTETSQSDLDTFLNGKGYYKIQDFASQVTDIILDTRYLKVFKCNKIVTISLDMTNQSGSDIAQETPLFKLPASITTSSSVGLVALIDGSPSWLEISSRGAELADTLPDNAVLLVSGSFVIN